VIARLGLAVLAAVQEHGPAAAADAAGAEHAVTPFTINPGLIIWTLVIFGILLFILAKTAWPAILKQIEEREARIRADLEAAAKANADAQALLANYQSQLGGAREEAAEIVAQARGEGEKLREEIVAKGRTEQEALLERARREIGLEKDRAVAELRRETVELSLAVASKIMERNLDSDADRKLVQDYLSRMPASRS
jgi:F-type H+-transporting ATPase subunit b